MTFHSSVQRKIPVLKYIYMLTIQRYTKSFELEVTKKTTINTAFSKKLVR